MAEGASRAFGLHAPNSRKRKVAHRPTRSRPGPLELGRAPACWSGGSAWSRSPEEGWSLPTPDVDRGRRDRLALPWLVWRLRRRRLRTPRTRPGGLGPGSSASSSSAPYRPVGLSPNGSAARLLQTTRGRGRSGLASPHPDLVCSSAPSTPAGADAADSRSPCFLRRLLEQASHTTHSAGGPRPSWLRLALCDAPHPHPFLLVWASPLRGRPLPERHCRIDALLHYGFTLMLHSIIRPEACIYGAGSAGAHCVSPSHHNAITSTLCRRASTASHRLSPHPRRPQDLHTDLSLCPRTRSAHRHPSAHYTPAEHQPHKGTNTRESTPTAFITSSYMV
jgi:hypothetical protein